MNKKQNNKVINNQPDPKLEGKVFGCSEIFTLDKKGKIIKREWKREEIKNWKNKW